MAASTLSVKLSDGTTVTYTYTGSGTNSDPGGLKSYMQWFVKDGGFFDDAGVWHPTTAIVSATINP